MRSNRRHYEAQVLVVPIGQDVRVPLESMKAQGLTRIQVLDDVSTVSDAASRADIVVFLLASLSDYRADRVATIAEVGRGEGSLVAALTVGLDDPTTEGERDAMRHLREQVDVLEAGEVKRQLRHRRDFGILPLSHLLFRCEQSAVFLLTAEAYHETSIDEGGARGQCGTRKV